MSDSLWPHGLQHARPLCSSLSPGVSSNSYSLSQWSHPYPLSSPSPILTWSKLQLILIMLIVLLTCTHCQKNSIMNLTASPLFSCREKVSIILQLHLGSMKSFSNPSWIQKKYRAAKWGRTIPNKMFLPYKGNGTMKHQIYFRCGKGYFTFSLNYLLHLSE